MGHYFIRIYYITTFVEVVQGLTIMWRFSCTLVFQHQHHNSTTTIIIINLFFKQNNKDLSVKLVLVEKTS